MTSPDTNPPGDERWGDEQRARERELLELMAASSEGSAPFAAAREELITMHLPLVHHIAVLNKIDGLWDPLKTPGEIEREVRRQCAGVAATLDLDRARKHRAGMGFFRDRRPELYRRMVEDV